jgi:pilus assembly protein CpaC
MLTERGLTGERTTIIGPGGELTPAGAQVVGPVEVKKERAYERRTSIGEAQGLKVINMLHIPGEQQVMLKVVVAEVNRAAARSIGLNWAISNDEGMVVFANRTGNLLTGSGQTSGSTGTGGGGMGGTGGTGAFTSALQLGGNLPALLDNGQVALAIQALRTLKLARSLAEPNLVALNGRPASFLAGGQFPVPIVTGFTAAGLQGVSFVPFGVQLQFVPAIMDKDRIRLNVNAEVSTRDVATGTMVGTSNVPGLSTRNFATTVELREGQTLAIAGLIQNNFGADSERVPGFGDVPILGRLFNVDRTSYADQELIVLVTPQLVHPLDPHESPPITGADVFEPGDIEFYLLGRMESRRSYDYRSSVRNDLHRMIRYRHCEDIFILGPHGHSDGRH